MQTPTPPTSEEVREARQKAGLTQSEAAALIHLSDSRVWRQYESGGREMHPAFWELFLRKIEERTGR